MKNSQPTDIPGTGWSDTYLGGSPQAEQHLIDQALSRIEEIQQHVSKLQKRPIRRAFHNKGITFECAFTVSDDLPDYLNNSFLTPGREYSGFGRFSRSQSLFASDQTFDQRGFAFRLQGHGETQDFLMSNTAISFAADPVTFLDGGLIFATSPRVLVPFKLIRRFGFKQGIQILKRVTGGVPDLDLSFSCQQYWSRTPFQVNHSAVRYTAKPLFDETRKAQNKQSEIALDIQLQHELAKADIRYRLYFQLYQNADDTPLDRTDLDWPENIAPLVPIGLLTIPQQDISIDGEHPLQQEIENSQAFNPWTTRSILPLGSMNRSRRLAYKNSAVNRNAQPAELLPEKI